VSPLAFFCIKFALLKEEKYLPYWQFCQVKKNEAHAKFQSPYFTSLLIDTKFSWQENQGLIAIHLLIL